MRKYEPVDLSLVATHPIDDRANKVLVGQFGSAARADATMLEWLECLPDVLAGRTLREVIARWVDCVRANKTVILAMGAHPIKCGLAPIIARLVEAGAVTAVAMNGAASIHDFEVALIGATSEDVAAELQKGTFGFADETGARIHDALKSGLDRGWGYGEALARRMLRDELRHADRSVLCACQRAGVQATVHVALGTDVIHHHPAMSGAVVGEMTHRDFLRLSGAVRAVRDGGLFINLGSAVIMPEVFLKALSICKNLDGPDDDFYTLDLDMFRHYRPHENVVRRPHGANGRGYALTGHHEILLPLLAHCVLERMRIDRS